MIYFVLVINDVYLYDIGFISVSW